MMQLNFALGCLLCGFNLTQNADVQVQLLRSETFMQFRQANTNMVLGTDMKKHFDIMSRFQV